MTGETSSVPVVPAFTVATTATGEGELTTTVAGEVDMVTSLELAAELERVIDQGPDSLVIDMADVGFCDSRGLGTLVRANSACAVAEIKFRVVASARVRRILDLTGLAPVLSVESAPGE